MGSVMPMNVALSQCGGEMMPPAVVSHLELSALLSNEATTPHIRANCYCGLDWMLSSVDAQNRAPVVQSWLVNYFYSSKGEVLLL
jgi:hypothetical protein